MNTELGPRVYLLRKPVGPSSFDLIRRHKRTITQKKEKIGHFGTLDPFASGLLMLGVGGASRLNELIHEFLPKTYLAKGMIGSQTTTGDHTGEVVEKLTEALQGNLFNEELFTSFIGPYLQRPPFFSAAKHEGKELYRWAREGVSIEKPPVERVIYELELLEQSFPEVSFRCRCSVGTYIRVLFEDIVKAVIERPLGHLRELEREAVGHLHIDQALDLSESTEQSFNGDLPYLELFDVLKFSCYELASERVSKFKNGLDSRVEQTIEFQKDEYGQNRWCWVFGADRLLLGLGEIKLGSIHPKIVFKSS